MKRLLILANNDAGLYKFRKELIKKFLEASFEVYVSIPDGPFIDQIKELGCTVFITPIERRGVNPFKDIKILTCYRKLLHGIKPSFVITYTIKPNIYGGFICSLSHCPYFVNITGLGSSFQKNGLLKYFIVALYKISLRRAGCVFFENQHNQEIFGKYHIIKKNNHKVLHGAGINLEEYDYVEYPKDEKKIRILFIGRIMKEKGIDELLHVIPILKEKYSDLTFDIIGPLEEEYGPVIERMATQKLICYHGFQTDVRPFIRQCHALILPSYHEGMSNVLLESASIGRPLLTTRIAGCKETFIEGETGIGFTPQNIPELQDAIEKFLALPWEKKKQMGYKGRKKMEQEFDKQHIVEITYQTIMDTVKNK